eukprot:299355-Pleurochrysis_carterae.AAC.1
MHVVLVLPNSQERQHLHLGQHGLSLCVNGADGQGGVGEVALAADGSPVNTEGQHPVSTSRIGQHGLVTRNECAGRLEE